MRTEEKGANNETTKLVEIKLKDQTSSMHWTSITELKWNFSKLSLFSAAISHLKSDQFEKHFKSNQLKQENYMNASNFCPIFDEIANFSGPTAMGVLLIKNLREYEIARIHSNIESGGHWKPKSCLARHK
ncbi:unnamed protein product, partial [Acanthocheilonema viteae]